MPPRHHSRLGRRHGNFRSLPRQRGWRIDVDAYPPEVQPPWPPRRRRGRSKSHPAVIFPFVVGAMLTFAAGPPALPVAIFCFFVGAMAWRSRRRRAQRARQQIARAAQTMQSPQQAAAHEPVRTAGPDPDSLAGLQAALEQQNNPRAVAEAKRLATLHARRQRPAADGGVEVPAELKEAVDQLFAAGQGMLRKAVRLGRMADQLSTPEAQEEMGALQDELIEDLAETNHELAHALDQLQLRSARQDRPEREVDRLRRELDEQLHVARRVDERLDILDDEIRPDAHERAADGW